MIDLDAYETHLKNRYANEKTRQQFIDVAKRFNNLNLEVNQAGVEQYLGMFKNNILNRTSLKHIASFLNVKEIIVPKLIGGGNRKRGAIKFLTKEQMDMIIAKTSLKTSLLVRLMFETGLRLNETLNLKRKDIDLDKRTVSGTGKRGKTFDEPFSIETGKLLAFYLPERRKEIKLIEQIMEEEIIKKPLKKIFPLNKEDLLLYPFHYENTQHHDKKFYKVLKKECEALDILGVHPHRIRHSLGHYLRADMHWDLMQVREKLRHDNITTTQIYSTATKEEVDKKIKKDLFKDTEE